MGRAMPNDAVLQVRLDAKMKSRAEKILRRLGMTPSDAVRMFLAQIVEEKGLPFRPHIPNAESREAIEEALAGGGETIPPGDLRSLWNDVGLPEQYAGFPTSELLELWSNSNKRSEERTKELPDNPKMAVAMYDLLREYGLSPEIRLGREIMNRVNGRK